MSDWMSTNGKPSFSLEEVARDYLPAEWTDSVRWLSRRLNRGDLSGYRVGKTWRMTPEDVEFLVAKHRNAVRRNPTAPAPELTAREGDVSFLAGLSERSRRRIEGRSA